VTGDAQSAQWEHWERQRALGLRALERARQRLGHAEEYAAEGLGCASEIRTAMGDLVEALDYLGQVEGARVALGRGR